MAYANPFSNPFTKPTVQRHVPMDEDEDDDLKLNTPQTTEPLTERQKKFAKFKQLQEKRQNNPETKVFKLVETKNKKKKAKKNKSKHKASKQRANSLPRTTTNDPDNNNTNKADYIYFHEPQQQQTSIRPPPPSSAAVDSKATKQTINKFEALNLETSSLTLSKSLKLKFDALSKNSKSTANLNIGPSVEVHTACYRSIRVPGHRMVHVRRLWKDICDPIIKQLKLQIRMNSKKNLIELRIINLADIENMKHGKSKQNVIQKGSDFIRAVVMGFEIKDALALIRMDDIYLESFDIRDVKFFNKKSDHWMRAIGRIAGQYGKIKYSIENSTNTRIVIFGFKVYILGSFSSIRLARNSISRLVMGSAPGNVYAKLRVVSNRLKHKF